MTADAAPAIVVMAEAPRPGAVKARLEPLLGRDGCARLQAALVARAAAWAVEHAAPGAAHVAYAPAGAGPDVARLVPDGVTLLPQAGDVLGARLEGAFRAAAKRTGRAVIMVGTDVPGLGRRHAQAVADDLAAGVDVSIGPATDGTYYLIAAREPHPALFAIDPAAWGGGEVTQLTLASLLKAELSVGLLRTERVLATPGDAAALVADPLAPPDVVAALTPASRA
ncbi:MAG TPA: DUF2064 domain-containing protein [Capillimicrobium sp.]|nr:DUF2064 domain-containing protein [Capillimicrobium sp.]